MLLIEYIGHIGLTSLTDGLLGRHLDYYKTLNDARVASAAFIKYNASTTRINKGKNFKIDFQVILVVCQTNNFLILYQIQQIAWFIEGWHARIQEVLSEGGPTLTTFSLVKEGREDKRAIIGAPAKSPIKWRFAVGPMMARG